MQAQRIAKRYIVTFKPYSKGEFSREFDLREQAYGDAGTEHGNRGLCFVGLDRETGETFDCEGLHEEGVS